MTYQLAPETVDVIFDHFDVSPRRLEQLVNQLQDKSHLLPKLMQNRLAAAFQTELSNRILGTLAQEGLYIVRKTWKQLDGIPWLRLNGVVRDDVFAALIAMTVFRYAGSSRMRREVVELSYSALNRSSVTTLNPIAELISIWQYILFNIDHLSLDDKQYGGNRHD